MSFKHTSRLGVIMVIFMVRGCVHFGASNTFFPNIFRYNYGGIILAGYVRMVRLTCRRCFGEGESNIAAIFYLLLPSFFRLMSKPSPIMRILTIDYAIRWNVCPTWGSMLLQQSDFNSNHSPPSQFSTERHQRLI